MTPTEGFLGEAWMDAWLTARKERNEETTT